MAYDDFIETDREVSKELSRLAYSEIGAKDRLSAKVAYVTEPLKVRTLTKGESLPYHQAKVFQKELFSKLSVLTPFGLIGRTVEERDIDHLRSLAPPGFDFLASGDYSAATDGIRSYIQQEVMGSLLDLANVQGKRREVYEKVLDLHTIEYPCRFNLDDVEQRQGQLMGSPLSFPVLCIVNFLTWVFSQGGDHFMAQFDLFRTGRRGPLSTGEFNLAPVLINGDDILFPTNQVSYQHWLDCLPVIGFDRSPGKNLVSNRFCTINTTLFRTPCGKPCEMIPYANVGLLTHGSKVNGKVSDFVPFWDIHNKIKPGFQNPNFFTQQFLKYYSSDIAKATSGGKFNLYIPRSAGGCGLDGKASFISPFQRRLATYLSRRHRHPGKIQNSDVGLIGKSLMTGRTACPHPSKLHHYKANHKEIKTPPSLFELGLSDLKAEKPLVTRTHRGVVHDNTFHGVRVSRAQFLPPPFGWKVITESDTYAGHMSGILDETVMCRRVPIPVEGPIYGSLTDEEVYDLPEATWILTHNSYYTPHNLSPIEDIWTGDYLGHVPRPEPKANQPTAISQDFDLDGDLVMYDEVPPSDAGTPCAPPPSSRPSQPNPFQFLPPPFPYNQLVEKGAQYTFAQS